jgi:hypothetical protein
MAGTKSNGTAGGERRRRSRSSNGGVAMTALAADGVQGESAWLGRVDALADRLAGLDDRATIIDHLVAEAMQLLPADEVRVYADATTITAASFTEENAGGPARAVIPLAIAGRHFGAVEIAMKPQRVVGPGERALSIALARQCALAIDSLMMRKAQRASVDAALASAVLLAPTATPVDIVAVPTPAPVVDVAAAPIQLAAAAPALDVTALQATLGRLESDVRALAKLARSAELPPAPWVDRAELTALRRLDEARAQLGTRVENAA